MRHRKSGRQLNRNSSHRKAMLKNMTCSLFEHELIRTTVPKARELRRVAEPLITLAKADSVANRRLAFARVGSKAVVGKLFKELGVRYQERPGGYTRILKSGFRPGDAAPMAFVELVGRPMPDDDDIDNADNNFVAPDDDKVIEVAPTEDTKPVVEQEGWFKRLRKRFLK